MIRQIPDRDFVSDDPVLQMRHCLGAAGYRLFDVSLKKRKGESDILLLHRSQPGCPVWIYRSAKGRLVVRSWGDSFNAKSAKKTVPKEYHKILRMMICRPVKADTVWHDWLSKESLCEAFYLGMVL